MKPNNINNFFSDINDMAEMKDFHKEPRKVNKNGVAIEVDISHEVHMIREYIYMLENEINNTNDRIAVEKSIEEYVEEISNKIINKAQEAFKEVMPTLQEEVRKFNSIASSDWEDFEYALKELDSTLFYGFSIILEY